jgi:nucleoside-diphosphate-sugar epimerase
MEQAMLPSISVIGLGWVGLPLAIALQKAGYPVIGSKTTAQGMAEAQALGIKAYPLQLPTHVSQHAIDPSVDWTSLMAAQVLVITLPAKRSLEGSLAYVQAVKTLSQQAAYHGVGRIILLSSTSIYGEPGCIVNEDSPCVPITDAGRAVLAAEQHLLNMNCFEVCVLRLAGLVGPNRHPAHSLAGKTGVLGAQQGVNWVHQIDVIEAIRLAIHAHGTQTWNVCAPMHPKKAVLYPWVASELKLVSPIFADEPELRPGKIVDGQRITQHLGLHYRYPNPMLMHRA